MRTNANIQPRQVWVSSDPRRLRKVQVVHIDKAYDVVLVKVLYPVKRNRFENMARDQFMQTGTKGYTRIS